MVLIGLILLVVGLLLGSFLLVALGVILLVVGLVLGGFGAAGRPVRGRRHYW